MRANKFFKINIIVEVRIQLFQKEKIKKIWKIQIFFYSASNNIQK